MPGFQQILEVEHIHDGHKIKVTRSGEITIVPLPGQLEGKPMSNPPKEFWDNLSSLIKNMDEHITQLGKRLMNAETELVEMDERVGELETKQKYMPINSGSKQKMFIAGMTMGKNMRRT
jgi:hypothetical protein